MIRGKKDLLKELCKKLQIADDYLNEIEETNSVNLYSYFFTKIIDNRKQIYIHTNNISFWNSGFRPNVLNGTIAQRESTSLTSKGSLVQSQLVPPFFQNNFLCNII